ncbi:probable ubiquitin carboxyl-terminal hydrolase MINDY-4 isoform X5 [Salvelinus alpinus]|uniref:probable ubiquitin carboxyl-terminal hydrolase MINDY-4 isoform X5 n=1 Tax=Salvelinus alpinus TaxID=8036 RepID=UPI0039FD7606
MPQVMVVRVEEVAASLVREFLSRKGLKRTIACMDEEHPRTDGSINNRSDLRQILHLEGLYKNNKAQDCPLKSMLEIIVRHHIEGHKEDRPVFNTDVIQTVSTTQKLVTKSPILTPTVYDHSRAEENTTRFIFNKTDMSRSLSEVVCPPHGTLSSFEVSDTPPTTTQRSFWSHSLSSDGQQDRQHVPSFLDNDSGAKRESFSDKNTVVTTESTHKNKTSRLRRGMMAGPIASSPQESNRKRQTRRLGGPNLLLANDENHKNISDGPLLTTVQSQRMVKGLTELSTADPMRESQQPRRSTLGRGFDQDGYGFERVGKDKHKTSKTKSMTNQNVDVHMSEMILDDIDDDEELRELSRVSCHSSSLPQTTSDSQPMDQHTAIALKELILGSRTSCFSAEWRSQSFTFSDAPDLRYGLVQKKGGPCGVLASVQACILQKLLFEGTGSDAGHQRLRPSGAVRTKCLTLATAEILWRAGEGKKATIAITSGRNHFTPTGHHRSEGVLEKITCIDVDNLKDLQLLVEQHIQQELVNLLLCGQAVSNVFNNNMELDSGNGNLTLLKGIRGRSDIGLLSLFEHYNICKVGSNLKTPKFPIWVVCSESHFSVLFGVQELLSDQCVIGEFDLYYYDGLANQQEEICLTVFVGTSGKSAGCQGMDTDLIPPLEHCIRTKWKDAIVNWNDTEPIL